MAVALIPANLFIRFSKKREYTGLSASICIQIHGTRFPLLSNASEDAKTVDAVLTQNDHPVAYESTKLSPHQLNYPIHDKEIYAIIHVERFVHLRRTSSFTTRTTGSYIYFSKSPDFASHRWHCQWPYQWPCQWPTHDSLPLHQ